MPKGLQLRKRFFARLMSSSNADRESVVSQYRRRLLAGLHGDVLEIGPGSGANLAYYPRDIHWIGIEPNPFMHGYLKAEAARLGLNPDLRSGMAEQLDAPDESADVVVCTHVLCSVTDQQAVLREVLRVLKPGGQFVFIEHVAAPQGTSLRTVQNLLRPAWQYIADGCHPNRETWRALEGASFSRVNYERVYVPWFPPIVSPHIAGNATK